MRNYRPLLIQQLDVRLPGLHLRRLRLNRHLPEVDSLSPHAHGFAQILCYLGGRGTLSAEGCQHEIGPGSIALLPPHGRHSFRETSGRRPLCLVIDLDLRGAAKGGVRLAHLNLSEAASIRHELSNLTRLRDPNDTSCRMMVASVALRVVDTLLRAFQMLPPQGKLVPPFVREFDRLVRQPEASGIGISELAQRLGYQSDYLNRVFKQSTGRSLREHRDALQIERAKRLLGELGLIKDVCDSLGFPDQNYFSRWFKKHTGVQPSLYRRMPARIR